MTVQMEPASLTLNRDELNVFLTIMGVATMNGLDDEPLADLDEGEIEQRMNSGEQSLLSRGLISFEEDNMVLDDTLVALVGGSVIPEATFLFSRIDPGGDTEPVYFNATPELLIQHSSPRAGIFLFEHLPDPEGLTLRVQTLLAPLHPMPSSGIGESLRISAAALTRFMELARGEESDGAAQELTGAGVPDDVANALAEDFKGGTAWVGVVAWGLREEEPQGGNSVMSVMGEDRCWLVRNVEDQPEDVMISSPSGEECEEALVGLLRPLQEALKPSE